MELDIDPIASAIPPERQWLEVKFKPEATRTYRYHNDGPPVAVGDMVQVPSFRGEGWQRVEVVKLVEHDGSFETKPINVEGGVA